MWKESDCEHDVTSFSLHFFSSSARVRKDGETREVWDNLWYTTTESNISNYYYPNVPVRIFFIDRISSNEDSKYNKLVGANMMMRAKLITTDGQLDSGDWRAHLLRISHSESKGHHDLPYRYCRRKFSLELALVLIIIIYAVRFQNSSSTLYCSNRPSCRELPTRWKAPTSKDTARWDHPKFLWEKGQFKDLIDLIKENIGNFTYILYEVEDGTFGTMDDNGNWNGLMGALGEKQQLNFRSIFNFSFGICGHRSRSTLSDGRERERRGLHGILNHSEHRNSCDENVENDYPTSCLIGKYALARLLLFLFWNFQSFCLLILVLICRFPTTTSSARPFSWRKTMWSTHSSSSWRYTISLSFKSTILLQVLEWQVWLCIVAAYVITSLLLWVFDRFSPYSYSNNKVNTPVYMWISKILLSGAIQRRPGKAWILAEGMPVVLYDFSHSSRWDSHLMGLN